MLFRSLDVTLETGRGILPLRATEGQQPASVTVELGEPVLVPPPIYTPYIPFKCVELGGLYFVLETERLKDAPVESLGPKLAGDPALKDGADIVFAEPLSASLLALRVWKKEGGEAAACGTAAAAALYAMALEYKCDPSVTVRMAGGEFSTIWDEDGSRVYVTGPVTRLFEGNWRE